MEISGTSYRYSEWAYFGCLNRPTPEGPATLFRVRARSGWSGGLERQTGAGRVDSPQVGDWPLTVPRVAKTLGVTRPMVREALGLSG